MSGRAGPAPPTLRLAVPAAVRGLSCFAIEFRYSPRASELQPPPWRHRRSCMTMLLKAVALGLTVVFAAEPTTLSQPTTSKIDQLMPMVGETVQSPNRRSSPLKSRAQISGGSGSRFFALRGKNCAENSSRYHYSKQSSGSDNARVAGQAGSVRI